MTKKTKIFSNQVIDKKQLKQLMAKAFVNFGMIKAAYLGHVLKDLGFVYATKAGLSISIEDLRVPASKKNLVVLANEKVKKADLDVLGGNITEVERFQKVIQTWTTTSESLKNQVVTYFSKHDPLNSVYMMAFSGARGNLSQVRQLVGMRGLMADPAGQLVDIPIVSNFREGLSVSDYIISSYGARKGLVDTAIRTADSGYLTRRLIDVAHEMVTREKTCISENGIIVEKGENENRNMTSLYDRCIGRVLAQALVHPTNGKILAKRNQEIRPDLAKLISSLNIKQVVIRSPLTCSSSRSVCQECYGWNLAYGNLIDLGEAIGIIAAQSIGEPGTQLTMRTFHTGGVFTSEPSLQIRANYSGKIVFSPKLKTQKTRTPYGEVGYETQNEGSIALVDYSNKALHINIASKTLLLVSNNNFVCKDDILYEGKAKTIKSGAEQGYKRIYAKQSGEIILEKNKQKETNFIKNRNSSQNEFSLFWILEGEVYNVAFTSSLKIQPNFVVKKYQSLSESLILSSGLGVFEFPDPEKNQQIDKTSLQITSHPLFALSSNLYLEKQEKGFLKTVVYGKKNRKIDFRSFQFFSYLNIKLPFFGDLINTKYKTKSGGHFYSTDFLPKKKLNKTREKTHGTLFYVPESSYKLSSENGNYKWKNGDILEKNSNLFENVLVQNKSLVEIFETQKGNFNLILKPGKFLSIEKNQKWKFYHKNIVYSGEILPNKLEIKNLSYSEIKTFNKKTFLCLYPIVKYEIIFDQNEFLNFHFSSYYKETNVPKLPFVSLFSSYESKNTPLQLVKHQLPFFLVQNQIFSPKVLNFKTFNTLNFDLFLKNEKVKLNLDYYQPIVLKNTIPNEIQAKNLVFGQFLYKTQVADGFLNKKQIVEPYTKLASFQVVLKKENEIVFMKKQILTNEKKILLITKRNYKKVFLSEASVLFDPKKTQFLRQKEKTKTNFIFPYSGFIYETKGDCLSLHLGQPYLLSDTALIEKQVGDLVKEGQCLGQLIYEKARTGDIIQGLPKVERVLEARKPKIQAILAKYPGFFLDNPFQVDNSDKLNYWIVPRRKDETYLVNKKKANKDEDVFHLIPFSERLVVSNFEFVNVGQPLNDAVVNPHTLLQTYYIYYQHLGVQGRRVNGKIQENYFESFQNQYYCAYASFRKIQSLILNSVQSVYFSQGVNIDDKHVEIIIKQMTNKVEVSLAGQSSLVPYELVKLNQVRNINACLQENKEKAVFHPVLLGITKAALKTESFISAASFQHTTRILTEAAILGKVDWLHGLKENVIIGRLIPSGTGLTAFIDISYMKTKVGPKPSKKSRENFLKEKESKKKDLQTRIKFKLCL